ncbi:hypothetical protein Goshw_025547 [Gossypium schwendimanii]|uniref:Large ribosomal subunit protein bL28c n=1 Tax=Gossypium schwendimanii TaxID=34291 RepID=A0A7J9LC22_GOSSC|nr:hypothetical protein [Gossypium schwendimanii]
MATLATVGSSSVLRFNKTEPLKTNPSSPFLGFVTSQLSGIKISCNLPVVVAPLKPISSPFTPALQPVARKYLHLFLAMLSELERASRIEVHVQYKYTPTLLEHVLNTSVKYRYFRANEEPGKAGQVFKTEQKTYGYWSRGFLGRICPFTGKKANKANKVSFSNHKTKKLQFVNLQYKKVWWEAGKRYVKLRLSTKALKTIEKNGLDAVAKKAGIDLRKE